MRRLFSLTLVIALAASSTVYGQARPEDDGFRVNGYTTGKQRDPVVAKGDDGLFVVVWRDNDPNGSAIAGRLMDDQGQFVGSDFQIDTWTTAISHGFPSVSSLGSEGFVVAWSALVGAAGDEVLARLLDSTGTPLASEFAVNSNTSGFQFRPVVSGTDGGDFAVVWEDSPGRDGDGTSVHGALFDSTGSPLASEFQANTYTTGDQDRASVAFSRSGEFLVTWTSFGQDGDDRGIFAQAFDAGGFAMGSEFQVNSFTTGTQYDPQVGADRRGGFVVIWTSEGQDGSADSIHGQFVEAGRGPVGPEFRANTHTPNNQRFPAVSMGGFGEFVVTWTSYGQDGSEWGAFGQRFDPTGFPRGDEFQVNTYTTGFQLFPVPVMGDSGEFVVVWEDRNGGTTDYDVTMRRYEGPGPSMTSHSNGGTVDCSDPLNIRPTFAWNADGYEKFKVFMGGSSGFEKRTRVTSGDRWIKATSWMPNKKKWKRACRKAFDADPGSPVMYVGILAVDRDLSRKNPARKVFMEAVELDFAP